MVERNKDDAMKPLPMLPCELSVSMKRNSDNKKSSKALSLELTYNT